MRALHFSGFETFRLLQSGKTEVLLSACLPGLPSFLYLNLPGSMEASEGARISAKKALDLTR